MSTCSSIIDSEEPIVDVPVWDKFAKYFDVEARVVPLDANTKVVDPEKLIDCCKFSRNISARSLLKPSRTTTLISTVSFALSGRE